MNSMMEDIHLLNLKNRLDVRAQEEMVFVD
jgi:hypothetical protein